MTGFSQSGENRRTTAAGRRVVVAYTGLLSRVPTAAEYTGLAAALTDGTLTPASLTRRLIESQSYGQRFL